MESFLDKCLSSREKIYENLVYNPEKVIQELWMGEFIPMYRDCEIQMDARNDIPGVKDITRCESCKVLQSMITDLTRNESKIVVPGVSYYNPHWEGIFHTRSFHVLTGKYQGMRLIAQRRPIGKKCVKSTEIPVISDSMASCNKKKNNLVDVILCDNISSEILMTIMVQSLVVNVPKLLGIYSCGLNTYLLQESTVQMNKVDFSEFSNSDIWGLVKQLWYYFYCLRDYQYSHGYPDVYSLNISKTHLEPLAFEFGDFRLGIEQGSSSSMSVGERRYITKNILPMDDLPWIEEITQWEGTEYYVINQQSIPMLIQKKSYGYPIYTKSLDLYSMLIGLCSIPEIRKVIVGYKILRLIFSIPGEVDIMLQRVSKVQYPNFRQTLDILQGLRLRCDIVNLYPKLS